MVEWRKEIESQFGPEVFDSGFKGEVVSSGSFVVDLLTEIGGFPLGSIVEIFGTEGSGKTTLGLSAIKSAIDEKRPVLFEDFECTVSDVQLKKLGIDAKKMKDYRVTPDTLEDGWMLIKRFCETYQNGLIVVDSLAAMPPMGDREKMKKVIGDVKIASTAHVMSTALKQMTKVLRDSGNCLVFINQERAKISGGIGGMKTTPGGYAVKFYSAVRLKMQERNSIKTTKESVITGKREEQITTLEVSIRILKNKYAPSYRKGKIYIRMNEGIDNIMSAVKVAEYLGWIRKGRGGIYKLDKNYSKADDAEGRKERGLENLRAYFVSEPKIGNKLLKDVRGKLIEKLKNKEA